PQAAQFGLREGNGIVFVSHVGDVYPSPFFPLVAGNVRGRSLTALYRRSKLFKELRDPTRLKGNCARCQYRRICGGSRSRAYVTFNDWSVSDPLCTYEPVGVQQAFSARSRAGVVRYTRTPAVTARTSFPDVSPRSNLLILA